jgi:hypothetical protein
MFERFTERARKVMSLARQEALRLGWEFIGTEHILLGILQEGGGVAGTVLKNLNVDLKRIRQEIEKLITPSTSATVTLGQLPFSPRCKRVIELAGEAAGMFGHDVIGTEHLLLGLLKEGEGVAAQALISLGLKVEEVRDMVLEVLGQDLGHAPERSPTRDALVLYRRAEAFRALEDRPKLQNPIEIHLQKGRCIALEGPNFVGKTSLVLALCRARAGNLSYESADCRLLDEMRSGDLSREPRPNTVCFISQGELFTASRFVPSGFFERKLERGEQFIVEFREGGLEAFAARYPALAKDLVTVTIAPPDAEECRQLLESARHRLMEMTGIHVTDPVLRETDRLAREKWPQMIPPWATLITQWKAESIQREAFGRGDALRLQKDIESLKKAHDAAKRHEAEMLKRHLEGLRGAGGRDPSIGSVRLAIAELAGQSSNGLK